MFVKYLLTIVEKLRKIIYRFEKGGEEIFLFLEEHEREREMILKCFSVEKQDRNTGKLCHGENTGRDCHLTPLQNDGFKGIKEYKKADAESNADNTSRHDSTFLLLDIHSHLEDNLSSDATKRAIRMQRALLMKYLARKEF